MVTLKKDVGAIAKEPNAQAEHLNEFCDAVSHPDNGQPILIMGIPMFPACLVHNDLSILRP